ncbi:hypothetical protein [uncultured Coprobacter sp.]|uniref:hypothetical protein n=1 Tax=uncultured Coprobacter sp. TaxID=1720550 RepID=UPI00263038DF|nr:hypothetical protein [uncultured Coprobacter sp.]
MLVYSIKQARQGRQASKIRALSKMGAQLGAQQASSQKLLKCDDSMSLSLMLQNEKEYRKTLQK